MLSGRLKVGSDLQIALIAALVGGGLAMLGSVLQHFLSLREDRIKRERDLTEKRREKLTEGIHDKSVWPVPDEEIKIAASLPDDFLTSMYTYEGVEIALNILYQVRKVEPPEEDDDIEQWHQSVEVLEGLLSYLVDEIGLAVGKE